VGFQITKSDLKFQNTLCFLSLQILCVMQVIFAHGFMCCDFSFCGLGLESCLFQVNNILNHQKF